MTKRPPYAPGCFGEAVGFADDAICGSCNHANECKPIHLSVLAALREHYGFKTKEPTRQVGSLPVKVQKIFDELGRSEEEVRSAMMAGSNPYSLVAGFVGIVCHVLLSQRQTTRQMLSAVIAAKREYNEATADVYARHSIQILQHCGVVNVEGDQIIMVSPDNQTGK